MQPLSNEVLLHIWEVGQRQHPVDQALTILAATHPDVPWEELARLSIGQRDDRLLVIYAQTFDAQLVGAVDCPQCQESLGFAVPIADMRPADREERIGHTYPLEAHGYRVRFRLPNSFDLAVIARQAPDSVTARNLLLQCCVLEATYQEEPIAVSALPAPMTDDLAAHMATLDPQADITIYVGCPACEHSMSVVLDVVTFLWGRITAQARRVLRDVHTLAQAYSWRETDILAMSPVRRQFYLDRLTS